jgi:translation initiation factor 2 subunit 2
MRTYEEMLKEAMEKIPDNVKKESRYEIPPLQTSIQGNRTFITNFGEIAESLRRDPKHISKYLFKELASPGHLEGNRLILQRKVIKSLIEKKIEDYINEFIRCKECKKPDTHFEKSDRVAFLKCEACGAKHALRKI